VSKSKYLASAISAICLANSSSILAQDAPSVEELWEIVQAQQAELERLRGELESTRSQTQTIEIQSLENSERLEVVADVMEQGGGSGGAAWTNRTTVGGYGEMLYNNETSGSSTKELDIQRFVLFVNHEFTDNLRFVSETEIEHSYIADDARAPGAVELEQAFLQWDYADNHNVLGGMYLVPIGLLNETHEPNTFYGVERNRIESRIIPTTYRVNGFKFAGQLGGGFSYDLGIHEGLFFESGNGGELNIRDSRQSGARSEMDALGYTGRVRYTGVPGLELGLALHFQDDMTQDGSTRSNIGRDGVFDIFGNQVSGIDGLLTEAHVDYRSGPFGLRALWAQWDIDSSIETVANNDGSQNGLGRSEQYGYYIEPSWRLASDFGVFARYEYTDEFAASDLGAAANTATRRTLLGFNYWLHPNAVFKFDYQFEDDESNKNLDGFNLGIGWQF
jgi:hypothetical protein